MVMPADPTPSPGGALLSMNAGMRDNRAGELRLDVLVFSSEPLVEPVEVSGNNRVPSRQVGGCQHRLDLWNRHLEIPQAADDLGLGDLVL